MKRSGGPTLGVDCGGTNLKLAVVDGSGKILRSRNAPIRYEDPPEKVIAGMGRRINAFIASAGRAGIRRVGMGIAGDVDPGTGSVRFSPNLNWKDVPLKALLSRAVRIPVRVENDANCAAWGAYCLDARRDCSNLICLTLGTGIGGGLILDRKLYRGSTGSAGEIGHMSIRKDGRACKCGSSGCLESTVGAWGLVRTAEEGLAKDLAPALAKMMRKSGPPGLTPKLIEDAARKGDPYCRDLWNEAGSDLGCALANLVNIFNPDRIVLGGGVSKAGDLLLGPALHSLGARAFRSPAAAVKVSISKFDETLGVVGAAMLDWE